MDKEKKFPEFITERLRLREMTLDDLDWYIEHFSLPEIVEGTAFPGPENRDEAMKEFQKYILDIWEQNTGLRWGIELKGKPDLIGSAGLYKWEAEPHRRAEIGYDLNPAYWGKGYMSEALEAVVEYGFEVMNLNRITLLALAYNDHSCRLARRLGFVEEGVMRENTFVDGRFVDDVFFALLRSDWDKRGTKTASR